LIPKRNIPVHLRRAENEKKALESFQNEIEKILRALFSEYDVHKSNSTLNNEVMFPDLPTEEKVC
jgi:hypothetical protein